MLKRLMVGVGAAALLALPSMAQAQKMKMPPMPKGHQASITGTVIDVSCKFGHNLTGDGHRMCAQVCADKGIPLAILGSDGKLYMPISEGMPGEGANAQLKPFAEQKVRISGMVYDAGGANAVVIKEIKKA
ncbi:MAG: hypothetical protein ACE5HT_10210 [Gemmatimonadales bacterium]